jgi:hypothetical protein
MLKAQVRWSTSLLIVSAVVLLLACLFPPREWMDDIRSNYRPPRGFLFRPVSHVRDWQSPHMYLARTARTDYGALAFEAAVIIGASVVAWSGAAFIERRYHR